MNATLASQILDETEITSQDNSPTPDARQPAGLLTVLLLPPVALLMATLPLVYLGLAGLIGWGVLEYSTLINTTFPDLPTALRLTIGLAPVIPAAILITMLIRPLLTNQKHPSTPFVISREDEPLLVSFIHRISAAAGSPRPAIIELDCEPRIAAGFSGGIRTPELRLAVGLPLLASLSQQSFGGALARELGPFAHPLIARLQQFIQRIDSLFRRMAEWKSPWEARVEQILRNYREDRLECNWPRWGLVICLTSIRVLFLMVRKILEAFALAGRALSAFPLRHLETQADAVQVALAGSANFCSTVRRVGTLQAAFEAARDRTVSLSGDNRLSRDFPGLVCQIAGALPKAASLAVREELDRSSSWIEFRPSINERIQTAYCRDDAGIFSPEKPASSLVRDPRTLGEIVTRHWYRAEWDFDHRHFELVSNEALNRDSARGNRQLDKAAGFFAGSLHPFRPIFPSRAGLSQFSNLPEIPTATLAEDFAEEGGRNRELLDRFDELVDARSSAVEFHQLALTGYPAEPGQGAQENSTDELQSIIEFLDRQLLQASMKLGPFEERSLRLIAVAVRNLGTSRERAAQLDNLFYHLAVIDQIYSVIPDLKDLTTRLGVLLRRQPDSDLSDQCGERFGIHMQVCELLKRIEGYLGSLPYPFDDYGENATMWDYLTADVGTRNEAVAHSTAMANAVVVRIGTFYLRVMGQLAMDLGQEPEDEDSTLFDRWAKLASL